MGIVSSVIVRKHENGNGKLIVSEHHTDHLGIVHEHPYSCHVKFDINQALLDWIPKLELYLVENEKKEIQRSIENGVDPASITRKYITSAQKAKCIVRALMLGEPQKLLKAAEYIDVLTDTQIENFFTSDERIRIREKVAYIIDNQTIINGDVREEL